MPINFTVTDDLFASSDDTDDVGIDADVVPLIGPVKFIPQFRDDRAVLAPSASPRPAGFKIRSFTGYMDDDGQLKSRPGGTVGVRLWANDPLFGINELWYKVEYDLATPIGETVKVAGGYLKAPTTDTPKSLVSELQQTGSAGVGVTRGDRGPGVDDVTLNGDGDVVFWVDSEPVGDPLDLDVLVFDMTTIDGGTADAEGLETIDGGGPEVSGSTVDLKRMQQRRGLATAWTSGDPILSAAEFGVSFNVDGTVAALKLGDGIQHWSTLKNLLDAVTAAQLSSAVAAAVAGLVNGAPGTLDALNELATALGNDPNFATTIATALAGKQPLDSDLTAIAALTTAAFGRSLLTAPDAATVRTAIGAGTGGGDASTNTASSVDSELALFSGTGGKTFKRATASGIAKLTAGVLGTATAGTDYQAADSDLTAIAALTTTAYGRGFLALADAAAARTAMAAAAAITGIQVAATPTGVAATDTAAIQAAHDALPAEGGIVMAHAGLYAFTNPGPTFTKKVHLIGISPADTNLAGGTQFWSNSTSAVGLTLNPTATWPTGIGSTIENISFINNDTLTPASGLAVRIVDATGVQIRRCSFFNFYDHVSIESGYAWAIQDNFFNNCGRYAIRLRNTVDPDSGDGTISGNWFVPLGGAPTPTAAIRWESNAGVRIVNNKFNQGSKQWGIAIDAAFQGDVKNTGGIYIWNNSIENISGTGIKLSRITGAFVAYLTSIQNNEFQTVGTGIELGAGWSNVILSGNVGKTVTTPVTSSGALVITQANNQWNGAVTDALGQSLIPTTNNTYSLGDSSHFFNSANLNTINSYYLNLYQNNSPFSGATQLQYQSPTSGNVVILPDASGLGTVEQFITLTGSYTLTSQTAAQKLFNATTNGAVTLPVGTYFFECLFDLSSMSASSGSFGFAFGGTATIASQKWSAQAAKAALSTPASAVDTVNTAANTALVVANTTTTGWAKITGKIRTSGVGTLIPQVSLGVAAAAVVGADSYFRIWAVGVNSVTNAGPWT